MDEDADEVPVDTFGLRLAAIRQFRGGLNVKRAASAAGIDDGTWHTWESGRSRPRDYPLVCQRIADAHRVSCRWLMMGGPLRPPSTKWYLDSAAAQAAA